MSRIPFGRSVKQFRLLKESRYISLVDFEFDPAKSAANKAEHGIDFEQAQEL